MLALNDIAHSYSTRLATIRRDFKKWLASAAVFSFSPCSLLLVVKLQCESVFALHDVILYFAFFTVFVVD